MTNMYAKTKTWNIHVGCGFACTYCVPTFQAQAKRQRHNCERCYRYVPHRHIERLTPSRIPSSPIVFVGGTGDISFAPPSLIRAALPLIHKRPNQTFYLQSKNPLYLSQFVADLPDNVVLVTTLETNRDEGYCRISKAPPPTERYADFITLKWPCKVVTIEPILEFDFGSFLSRIVAIEPEYVWLGFNSRPRKVQLPEPSEAKVYMFMRRLVDAGIKVKGKTLQGVAVPGECA